MSVRRISAALVVVLAGVAGALMAFAGPRGQRTADGSAASSTRGFDPGNMDRTCKPCDDFYQYAMGGWLKKTAIPAEYPEWGGFIELAERNEEQLHGILERASKTQAAAGSNEQKTGDFYASCMDDKKIESLGLTPLETELAAIGAVHDRASLMDEAAHLRAEGVDVLFAFGSDQDFKDSTRVIGEVNQAGIGLPDRDYYTKEDEDAKKIRDQYVQHLVKMFELAGDPADKAAAEAKTVMELETTMAKASMTNVDLRDPNKVYHKMGIAEVRALSPNIQWDGYFRAAGAPEMTELNISQPEFVKEVGRMLGSVQMEDWKTYFRSHLLARSANLLPDAFVQESFNFNGRVLTGSKELRPRYKRCVDATDNYLGEALGQVYVREYFPPEAKARAVDLVHNLLATLREDLQTLDWMSPETRKAATVKLDAFTIKIGYPDKWRDYSALQIDRGSYAQDVFRAARFENTRQLAKIGKPVDRSEWEMTPPTVNAYYNAQLNEIVFPAGILQPPFFAATRDDAYNYGAIGSVIGHEITHGFDDEGAQFDPNGNLKNWWTPQDLKNFQERGECVRKQFDGFVVDAGLHENGKLVLGESIADLGGLKIAYTAYQKLLAEKPRQDIDGFTPEQRFYLGYAQEWGSLERPEYAKLLTNTDPHPLPKFRVLGPLSNFPLFAKTYGCKTGDAMVREQVCKIW